MKNTCPDPSIINPLTLYGFELNIVKIPNLTYFLHDVNIPSISLPNKTMETPFSMIPQHGDKLDFESLNVRFLIDEKLENYKSLYEWIMLCGFPNNYKEVNQWRTKWFDYRPELNDSEYGLKSDATLSLRKDNGEVCAVFHFEDLVITSLGSVPLTSENSESVQLYCDASFSFRSFNLIE